MLRLRSSLCVSVIILCLALDASKGARATTFTKFDPPGSTTGFSLTSANGINNRGEIVGVFSQQNLATRAFLRDCSGFTVFNHPLADPHLGTHARGINNTGQIAGFFYFTVTFPGGSGSAPRGFVKSGATFSTIDAPLSIGATFVWGINDAGQIVGTYETADPPFAIAHGFVKDGATYTTVDFPGAAETQSTGINNAGQIVGLYLDSQTAAPGNQHGFLKDGATFTTVDVPGGGFNWARGINNLGQIVGTFSDATGEHGYLKDGLTFTTIDVPGASQTEANGINDAGQIVGSYFDGTGLHGFVTGTFTDCTPPIVTLSVTPAVLWPPNHKLVEIVVNVSASDDSGAPPEIDLLSITSSDLSNGLGDGNTNGDIVVKNGRIYLRAERSGGNARVYTITYRATDASGNTSIASATVTVPASQK